MITIYTPESTPRFQYIVSEILENILGLEVKITTDKSVFSNTFSAKINYSHYPIASEEIHIIPLNLLFEKSILEQKNIENHINSFINVSKVSNLTNVEQKKIDIFAISFYLLSRYEEYLPFEPDHHDRFTAKHSVAHRLGFLYRPLVQELALELKTAISKQFPNTIFPQKHRFQIIPTYDIDQAFSYKNKGFIRTIGGLVKDIFNAERWAVLFRFRQDPFDIFSYLKKITPDARYFFLLADWATHDKNIHFQNSDFQSIINKITEKNIFGIHPSYASNQDFFTLKKEISRLENISEKTVENSRQHFLKLRFPTAYQRLIQLGIKNDYTMGYADDIGFRASTALPFRWYDLENEQITGLKIHPFEIMDVTLKEYLKLSPNEAKDLIQNLIKTIQNVDGQFITLWHNSSFDKDWKDWKEVYEDIFKN